MFSNHFQFDEDVKNQHKSCFPGAFLLDLSFKGLGTRKRCAFLHKRQLDFLSLEALWKMIENFVGNPNHKGYL